MDRNNRPDDEQDRSPNSRPIAFTPPLTPFFNSVSMTDAPHQCVQSAEVDATVAR